MTWQDRNLFSETGSLRWPSLGSCAPAAHLRYHRQETHDWFEDLSCLYDLKLLYPQRPQIRPHSEALAEWKWAFFSLLKLSACGLQLLGAGLESGSLWSEASVLVGSQELALFSLSVYADPEHLILPFLLSSFLKLKWTSYNASIVRRWICRCLLLCYLFVRIYTENVLRLRILCTLILCLPSFIHSRLLVILILSYIIIENNRSILMAALQSDLLNFQKHLL